ETPQQNLQQKQRIFFAGDTGYSDDFKAIGQRFGYMDLSLIPIGAYEPRWFMKEMHVNPDEAVQIHRDVNSRRSIAMHWGSFPLTDEPLDKPPRALEIAKRRYQISQDEFTTVAHGEIVSFAE
ncbi:MAG: MBL fold metallo-hydrolase, partial [Psychrobium sp.]